jgi:hypothetical protein
LADTCEKCGHSHFSGRGTIRWQVSALRCPEFIRLTLSMWDDGIQLGTPNYRPTSLTHGRCTLKETGICVWQREGKNGIICSSPDLKPALWSLDRNPMDFYLQECPKCRRRFVYSHKTKLCPNKECPNKRAWSLELIDRCRYYRRPAKPGDKPMRGAKSKAQAVQGIASLRSQQTKPRAAVYAELKSCMYELARTEHGFQIDDSTLGRLADIAASRAKARSATRAA